MKPKDKLLNPEDLQEGQIISKGNIIELIEGSSSSFSITENSTDEKSIGVWKTKDAIWLPDASYKIALILKNEIHCQIVGKYIEIEKLIHLIDFNRKDSPQVARDYVIEKLNLILQGGEIKLHGKIKEDFEAGENNGNT